MVDFLPYREYSFCFCRSFLSEVIPQKLISFNLQPNSNKNYESFKKFAPSDSSLNFRGSPLKHFCAKEPSSGHYRRFRPLLPVNWQKKAQLLNSIS